MSTGGAFGASGKAQSTPAMAGLHLGPAQPWYKQAVIYQLHVKSFCDANGDGIGDFRGLTSKLPYLQDLGVTALWLLPFYPSPLKDDGYDIADYRGVHPSYGTLDDFRRFLDEAHDAGLKVVTELVINHTSDQHPWFQRARRSRPGTRERDYYVWSDTPEKWREARIIFQDFETSNWAWDPVASAYYWHRFYSHQPDLNFESEDVRREVLAAMDHWLDMGVDGLRLDAVPYLFEREGTNCENLPETHAFLKSLRAHLDSKYSDRMLLAEANQWPEDSRQYFGDGDECHMAFHFPVMPRLFMGVRMEDRFPIVDILQQTPPIPEGAQWATFLRNHDELTLEMVTDEERDYMYRVYARDKQARINLGIRRRLAPLMENDRRRIELMNALLFSLPGTPIVYYGDEIGMGDNVYLGDRHGVRTPMQWSADRNAGFSRATPQKLFLPINIDPESHYEAVNVESQLASRQSLLWWMRRLIAVRKRHPAFGAGSLDFALSGNSKVLSFTRRLGDDVVLVVANLSRFAQQASIPLPELAGWSVREVFGNAAFRPIGTEPYVVTLGPHAFLWLKLEPARKETAPLGAKERDALPLVGDGGHGDWIAAAREGDRSLILALERWLPSRRWWAAKSRWLSSLEIADVIALADGPDAPVILVVRAEFGEGEPERYVVPVAAAHPEADTPDADAFARATDSRGGTIVLRDAMGDASFASALLEFVARAGVAGSESVRVVGSPSPRFAELRGSDALAPVRLSGEQSNTSVRFGDRLVAKLFRRLDEGVNPDLELGRFLTERARFQNVPPTAGAVEILRSQGEPETLAIVQGFVPSQGDGWRLMQDALHRYFDRRLSHPGAADDDDSELDGKLVTGRWRVSRSDALPERAHAILGTMTVPLVTLGKRTAELHAALASDAHDPAFAPVPFSLLYQKSLHQSLRTLTRRTFSMLREHRDGEARPLVDRVLSLEETILARFRRIAEHPISALRTRIHGDYHLGQVLFTGSDFVIFDLEGEPSRTLSERRIKRSPLRDVAGMLRSLHYAAHAGLRAATAGGSLPPSSKPLPWARAWSRWAGEAFLVAWLESAPKGCVPESREDLSLLLETYLLEKAVYEAQYEMNNRPDWLAIPLEGILDLAAPHES